RGMNPDSAAPCVHAAESGLAGSRSDRNAADLRREDGCRNRTRYRVLQVRWRKLTISSAGMAAAIATGKIEKAGCSRWMSNYRSRALGRDIKGLYPLSVILRPEPGRYNALP